MKRYTLKNKGMLGVCKRCFQPLTDSDYKGGIGYCQKCDIILGIKTLSKLIEELIEVNK
jgi:hypothetical protein